MRIVIDVPSDDKDALVRAARLLLDGVICVNVDIMRRLPIPRLYEAGVVYRQEPPGPEEFANCLQVLGRAPRLSGRPGLWADCDDAVAYRCAELRVHGEMAEPRIIWRQGQSRYHAQVRRADHSIEDPCMILKRNEEERTHNPYAREGQP